jgi:hypothetical protein
MNLLTWTLAAVGVFLLLYAAHGGLSRAVGGGQRAPGRDVET